jgi:hypothetical protein
MATRLECVGARFGVLWLPPFACRDGEFVCLHVPEPGIRDGYSLPRCLTGRSRLEGLQVNGPGLYVDRPVPRRGFLGFLRNPGIASWLASQSGVGSAAGLELLSRYRTRPETRIGRMDWPSRSLIALEAAFLGAAPLIIFDTFGLADPSIREMYAVVERRQRGRAVIHVSLSSDGQRLCYPASLCVPLRLAVNQSSESGAA